MSVKLPIDINAKVGNYTEFRWKQILNGRTIEHSGAMPPTLEGALREMIDLAKSLQKFKAWVHAYLDGLGVPKEFPDGPHTREGCRIGDRMDWLVKQQETLRARLQGTEKTDGAMQIVAKQGEENAKLRDENAALRRQLEEADQRIAQMVARIDAAVPAEQPTAARPGRRGGK